MVGKIIATELIGSLIISLLGNGVMSTCILNKTLNDKKSVSLIIAFGWSLAITLGIIIPVIMGGQGHVNILVTILFFIYDATSIGPWWYFFIYMFSQIIGFILGQLIVLLVYREAFKENKDNENLLLCYTFKNTLNFKQRSLYFSEFVVTTLFLFIVFCVVIINGRNPNPAVDPKSAYLILFMMVFGISISLGGVSGPSASPTRDLSLRMIYYIQFRNKTSFKQLYKDSLPVVIAPIVSSVILGVILKFVY